ncbi:MAG: DUF4197 domain-containing protein [Qipengyuania sp.]|nr:DUF4197 domain-containing protein [Qipengyuania sp.]
MSTETFIHTLTDRRGLLGGLAAGGALLALPACNSFGGYSLVDAVQRLLYLSSERAFARMLQADGFWDQQVAALGLGNVLGARGDVLSRILTSGLFKSRLDRAFGEIAFRGAERAAPVVTEAVRVIGIDNAIDLVRGGPTAATGYLRGRLGSRLIDAMVPELGAAMRVASDPLVGQALAALTGVDTAQVATRFADTIDETIWREIGNEESAIRADPAATNDAAIIAIFGPGARF